MFIDILKSELRFFGSCKDSFIKVNMQQYYIMYKITVKIIVAARIKVYVYRIKLDLT